MPSCRCPRRTPHVRRSTVIFLASFARRWLYLREENCWGTRPIFSARHHDTAPCKRPQADQDQGSLYLSRCPPHNLLRAIFYDSSLHNLSIVFISGEIRHETSSRQRCVRTSLALCFKAAHQAFETIHQDHE